MFLKLRIKNCIWRSCLLSYQDEMHKLHEGLLVQTFCIVCSHFAMWFQIFFFNSANALELRITTGGHVCCLIATKWRNFLKYFTKMSSLVPFAPAVSEGRIKCEKVTMTDDEWRFMVAKGHELISSTRLYHLKWEVCIYRTFQQRTYQCPQRENSTSYLNL